MSLVLAANFLKSSSKCLLPFVSSGTRGKIHKLGIFGQKVSKKAIFLVFEGFWLITSIFVISFGWKLPRIFSLVSANVFEFQLSCKNSEFGIFSLDYSKMFIFRLLLDFLTYNFKFWSYFWLKTLKPPQVISSFVFE